MGLYCQCYILVAAACFALSREEFISDACHGEITATLTHNVLRCPVTGTKICIREVRYYQYLTSAECPPVLSDDTQGSGCCIHNENRCSWIANNVDDRARLQVICEGHSECDLHSAQGRLVNHPCVNTPNPSKISSVRSIKYNCIDNRSSCNVLETTAPTRNAISALAETSVSDTNARKSTGVTEQYQNSSPKDDLYDVSATPQYTGVVVGAVLGVSLACGLAVGGFLLYRRRRRQKDNCLRGGPNTIAATERNPTHYVGGNGTSSFSPGVSVAYSSPSAPFDRDTSTNVVYNTLTGNTEDPSDYTQLEANTSDFGKGDGSYINVPNKTKHGCCDEIATSDRLDTMQNEMNEDDYLTVVSANQEEGRHCVEMEQ